MGLMVIWDLILSLTLAQAQFHIVVLIDISKIFL